ncbi:MAG: (d)CMP kinase [Planctomycetes bacterium]|nr:(d)CMP kinase [Planctomycetota bacterium]
MTQRLTIAIDGPAGAGKSTCARRLAARLGYRFLDTGAVYRAVTLAALRAGVDPDDAHRVAELARDARIVLEGEGPTGRVHLGGEDVSIEIRGPVVTALVPTVAAHEPVRTAVIPFQRDYAAGGGVVAEGRDMGSVVFPDADLKFYLDADESVRAARRAAERGETDVAKVQVEIGARDKTDKGRKTAPLVCPPDAERIDTTNLSLDVVVEMLLARVQARAEAPRN